LKLEVSSDVIHFIPKSPEEDETAMHTLLFFVLTQKETKKSRLDTPPSAPFYQS